MSRVGGFDPTKLSTNRPVRSTDNVKVVCRFRPQNQRELNEGGEKIIQVEPPQEKSQEVKLLGNEEGKHAFTFDRVFDCDTEQIEVFEHAAKPIVESVMDGYNGTIFAYGQTGSGKTFTMEGPDIEHPKKRGIIPRIVSFVFEFMETADPKIEFTVKVSMFEIYLERIRDLIDPSRVNLSVHEDRLRGVYVEGATEEYVGDAEDVFAIMRSGAHSRATAATSMNDTSSRSHSIFMMEIKQRHTKTDTVKLGSLFLVDLAGSEKVRKTNASGDRLEEAKNINKSLSALGNVINALTDGKATHVPYRDSKLTRILQQSLGGNSKTCLVLAASPSSWNESETLSTLRFGSRAKLIKNSATINQELTTSQLKHLLAQAEEEIERLKALLTGKGIKADGRPGMSDDEKWDAIQLQDSLLDELGEKTEQLNSAKEEIAGLRLELDERINFYEAEISNLKSENSSLREQVAELKKHVKTLENDVSLLRNEVADKENMINMLSVPRAFDETSNEGKLAELQAIVELQSKELRELENVTGIDGTNRASITDLLASKEVENEKFKARIKELEARNENFSKAIRQHQEREKQFQVIIRPMTETFNRIKEDHARWMQKAQEKYKKTVKSYKEENKQLAHANHKLTRELENLRKNGSSTDITTRPAKNNAPNHFKSACSQLLQDNQQLAQHTETFDLICQEQLACLQLFADKFIRLTDALNRHPDLLQAVLNEEGLTDDDLTSVEFSEEIPQTEVWQAHTKTNEHIRQILEQDAAEQQQATNGGSDDSDSDNKYEEQSGSHKPLVKKVIRGGSRRGSIPT
eukprot:c17950_g1_i1.p1 GENE.c17950_g1_i1~~c17950_g1_i1.p1  ORF type:complete len:818 (-),score=339.85 c17950_g1_i1:40-2460(-)